jgi:hypothetical protein
MDVLAPISGEIENSNDTRETHQGLATSYRVWTIHGCRAFAVIPVSRDLFASSIVNINMKSLAAEHAAKTENCLSLEGYLRPLQADSKEAPAQQT